MNSAKSICERVRAPGCGRLFATGEMLRMRRLTLEGRLAIHWDLVRD